MSNFSAILFRIKERTLPEYTMARAVRILTVTSFLTTGRDGHLLRTLAPLPGRGNFQRDVQTSGNAYTSFDGLVSDTSIRIVRN